VTDGCAICSHLAAVESAGLPSFSTPDFVVAALPGFEVPGWVAVILRRHEEVFEDLRPGEAAAWGPLVLRTMAAVRRRTGAEKVYLAAQGERFGHWHVLVSARPADVPAELRGFSFVPNAARWIDPDGCAAAAADIAGLLAGKS
jgi:diadenosine tetraphosphate (Ap4A) HIT family hydrolase